MLAGDKPRNGLHWSRTVQRDHGGDILNTLWLQPHAHTGHARGLDLEHARRLSSGDHVIGLRVVVRYFAQRELWLPLLHHLHGLQRRVRGIAGIAFPVIDSMKFISCYVSVLF